MLLFGKQYTKNNHRKIGGVIKLFELFKQELKHNNVEFEVIDLNWRNYNNPLSAYLYIYFSIFWKFRKHSNISFHGTANEFIFIAPFIVFTSKMFGKRVSLRKFAGNFDVVFSSLNTITRSFVEYALRNSDVVCWETKHLVNSFSKYNRNTIWFPNVRPRSGLKRTGGFKSRFVFVGQIKKTKGIFEILEALSCNNANFTVDFYGPVEDDEFIDACSKVQNANYISCLRPNEVSETLINYDVLLLPTYHPGEGYPGVIIEAFACGLPVIASNWGGISEIVTNNYNGKIIEPKQPQDLLIAINSIDQVNYDALSSAAEKSFNNFDSDNVTKNFITNLRLNDEL